MLLPIYMYTYIKIYFMRQYYIIKHTYERALSVSNQVCSIILFHSSLNSTAMGAMPTPNLKKNG